MPTPAPPAPLTARPVEVLSSIPLSAKRAAAKRSNTLRGSWRLSDGREVVLTVRKCWVHDGSKVYQGPYPAPTSPWGIVLQCIMDVERGRDPFVEGVKL